MIGLTYKKNVVDMRESHVSGLLRCSRSCLWLRGDGVERATSLYIQWGIN